MKKIYLIPYIEVVKLHLKGSILENVGVNTGSKSADPGDSLSKKHNAFADFEDDNSTTNCHSSIWED